MKYLVSLLTLIAGVFTAGLAFAATGDPDAASSGFNSFAIGPAIIMAVTPGLGTLAQSRAAAAALEGIARNPQSAAKVQTPLILSLALMESLVIFSFVIAIILVFK